MLQRPVSLSSYKQDLSPRTQLLWHVVMSAIETADQTQEHMDDDAIFDEIDALLEEVRRHCVLHS